jgi:dipeptidyl aminopeptidase/acylaminoacyl peptidase
VVLTSFRSSTYISGCRWSPDGRDIYFWSDAGEKNSPYVISANGGKPKLLAEGFDGWSRDGKMDLFQLQAQRSGRALEEARDPVQLTRQGFGGGAIESTDGRLVYYEKDGGVWRVPTQGGEETRVLESFFNDNFAVVDQGIYFHPQCGTVDNPVFEFRYRKDQPDCRHRYARAGLRLLRFSPDGRWLLYAQWESKRNDLMLVKNFR